ASIRLRLMNAEVIQPEPRELFLKLRGGVDRTQDFASRGFSRERVAAVVQRLAGGFARLAVRERGDALLFVRHFTKQRRAIDVADLEAFDLLRDGQIGR